MQMEERRVLVVDDDAEWRETVSEYLGLNGFKTIEAANGLEALLQVKRTHPAAVVLDLAMPRLGGLEALKRIHAFDPAIKVVIVSGSLDPEAQRRAQALGVTAIFAKPVDPARILEALGGVARPTAAAPRAQAQGHDAAAGDRPTSQTRVLVVEDDPEMRSTLEEFLAGEGHAVSSAPSAGAALRAIALQPPDLVLLDIEMPGLSGVEALPAILALAPDAKVIMVSGTSDVEAAKRALALGAFDYVAKPVDMAYLAQTVATAAGMKRLEVS